MTAYKFAQQHCSSEPPLQDYFPLQQPLPAEAQPPCEPGRSAGQFQEAQGHVQDGPATNSQPASQGVQVKPVPHPEIAVPGNLPGANVGVSRSHSNNDIVQETAHGDAVAPSVVPGQQSRDAVGTNKPQGSIHAAPGLSSAAVTSPFKTTDGGLMTDCPKESAAQREGVAVTEGLHAALPEKSGTPSGMAGTSHGPGVSQREWWPRQAALQTGPGLLATVTTLDNSAEVSEHTNAASSEGTGGNVPAALGTRQRPAAASAAWAVRQQTGFAEEQSEAVRTSLNPSLQSGLQEAVLTLDEAWPSLQDAAGGQERQQLMLPLPQQQQQQLGLMRQLPAQQPELPQQLPPVPGQQLLMQQLFPPVHPLVSVHSECIQACQASDQGADAVQQAVVHSPINCQSVHGDDNDHMHQELSQSTEALSQSTEAVSSSGCSGATQPVQNRASASALGTFPQRPGQLHCEFYVRNGFCKFGQSCKFDHPVHFAVQLSSLGLPLRRHEPACPYYAKTSECKFGPSCKFDHPEPHEVAI